MNKRDPRKMLSHCITGALFDSVQTCYNCTFFVSDNPDQPAVEHFQMLRRQWASKAQLLIATLDGLPDADSAAVQGEKNRPRGQRNNNV